MKQPEKPEYAIWIYPWDMLDGGDKNVASKLSDWGFSVLSVATSYHGARLLLPHNPNRKVFILEDGRAYFHPSPSHYEKTVFKPLAASLAAGEDPLHRIISSAQSRRLKVHGWTVFFHNTRLGELHPESTIENVIGERYPYALCPSNPQSRAYAVALAKDLADHYELTALELEAIGFMGYSHLSHHDKAGIRLDLLHDYLLSVCFCSYCRERLRSFGVDPELTKTKFRKELETYFESECDVVVEEPDDVQDRLAEILGPAALACLVDARSQVVCSLVDEIRRSVRKDVQLVMRAATSCFVTGGDAGVRWQDLSGIVDRILLVLFHHRLDLVESELRRGLENRERSGLPLYVGLRAHYPDITSEPELQARLQLLKEQSVKGVQFYNYGLLPSANLGWIQKAVRGM